MSRGTSPREVTEERERELKFDVAPDWTMPDPAKLAPTGGSVQVETVQLETVYFDTVRHDLLRSGLTLRRRTGDDDEGWQLKVPDGDARIEMRTPLGGRGVPEELRTATLGVRAGAALRPVATLKTVREVHRIRDCGDVSLADIVVDSVSAVRRIEPAVTEQWREVEVELAGGDEDLLNRVARWLRKRGAVTSAQASKLARALGVSVRDAADNTALSGLVAAYLDVQFENIVRGDIRTRAGVDVVRPTRLATRRYRSVLRIFRKALDVERADALDTELAWFAAALGEVRDRQMLRGHLDSALADLPSELVVGPVAGLIGAALDAEQMQVREELARVMRSRRYFALLEELRCWHRDLPLVTDASAAGVAPFLARAEHKARKRLRSVPRGDGYIEGMHRARKASKRARYTAELSRPALGKKARAARKRAKKVQRRLGHRQDSVVAAEFLRRAAAVVADGGGNAFTLGVLAERERRRAEEPLTG